MSDLPKALFGSTFPVTQRFGVPNKLYKSGIHAGTDYATPEWTPIYAPIGGKIVEVWKSHPSMGNACLFTFYLRNKIYTMRILHLARAPQLGTYRTSEVIAYTGNTGMTTGPHLHIELWSGPYMPSTLLRAATVREKLLDPHTFEIC
jgi:murein DD-endopeptidase MepM/ murein hydrolase activator NlpD